MPERDGLLAEFELNDGQGSDSPSPTVADVAKVQGWDDWGYELVSQ